MQRLTKGDYQIRLGVLVLAFISPILCLILWGYEPSLSTYWKTEMQPLFIISNATTSFYLYQVKSWRPSALTLLLVTAFSVELYPGIHNVLAVVFFIITIYPLWVTHHFKRVVWIYIVSLGVLPFSMLGAEIIAIFALCLYHGLMLDKIYKLNKNKDE